MNQRVILSSHQPYAIKAMEIMARNENWTPVYWMCQPSQICEIRRLFGSNVITHSYLEAAKGKPAPDLIDVTTFPFDPALLSGLEEAIALAMLDRNDAFSQSMLLNERTAFFLEAMGYWTEVIELTKSTLVIFEETPHQAIDYALYLAARHAGVRCVCPVRGLPDAGFLGSDRIGPLANRSISFDTKGVRRGTGAVAFIDGMNIDYDTHLDMILWDHKDSVRKIINQTSMFSLGHSLIKTLKPKSGLLTYIRNFINFENDQKSFGVPLRHSHMNYAAFLWYKITTLVKKTKLRRIYQELSRREIDLEMPFIYCSLQYQPEASTSPMAGRYVMQWLMVAQLARHLPNGWRLYVKEHPSQFSGEYARYGESFRSREFYNKILSYANVWLVPLSLDSFTLIDHARAVAAPGGTVCFEAVARGKPVINFGTGFFMGCPGMWQATCERDVVEAISEINMGYLPDPTAVRAFAAEIDAQTYPGALGSSAQLARMQVTEQENAVIHAMCWRNIAALPVEQKIRGESASLED